MKLRVVVVGIPGVGKTTVVEGVVNRIKGAKLVTFGTVMLEVGLRLKWVKHRDELRRMPVEKQKRLQRIAAQKIANMRDTLVLVDTHLFVRTQEGFWPGLPFHVVTALKATHLVLIEADSQDILTRRMNDTTRYRDSVSMEELDSELSLARGFLTVASSVSGAPMLMLRNEEGRVDEAVQRLIGVLEKARA